jgi:hypothetical protein
MSVPFSLKMKEQLTGMSLNGRAGRVMHNAAADNTSQTRIVLQYPWRRTKLDGRYLHPPAAAKARR